MFPHHFDQISQKSQVSWVALCLSKVKVPGSWRFLPAYRFPRVFGDEFGDEFGDSLNFVSKLVTHLVMISVNHCIW